MEICRTDWLVEGSLGITAVNFQRKVPASSVNFSTDVWVHDLFSLLLQIQQLITYDSAIQSADMETLATSGSGVFIK
jgi:hypothetical protein